MSDTGDGGDPPRRALLLAVLAMLAVAMLVGLALAAAALTVVEVTGVGDGKGSAASKPSLYMPKYRPTKSASVDSGLPSASPSATESRAPKRTAKPPADKITLFAAPQKVAPGGRIDLNGVYVDGEGVVLQVQRKESAGWTAFPVRATVRGGSFDTWITTTRTGSNTFRVYDVQANRASNSVVVTVG